MSAPPANARVPVTRGLPFAVFACQQCGRMMKVVYAWGGQTVIYSAEGWRIYAADVLCAACGEVRYFESLVTNIENSKGGESNVLNPCGS